MIVLPDLVYDCVNCGRSCNMFHVEIMPDEGKRLQRSPVTWELQSRGYQPLRLLDSGRIFLTKREDGACTYLNEENLCSIHAQEGYAAKPWTCQTFPFHAEPTPDGIYIGLSYSCTAVAQQVGRSLEAHRADLTERFDGRMPEGAGWLLWAETPLEWDRYRAIEARLARGLAERFDLGLLQGAAALCQVVKTGDWSLLEASPALGPAVGRRADELLGGLLTLVETAGEPPERVEEVLRAIASQGRYHSTPLEREVVIQDMAGTLPDWYVPRTRQYLEHLLFRKTLLKSPNVLARACLLPLVSHAVRYFTLAAAAPAVPEPAHWGQALTVIEGRLMFHAKGMESYFERIGRGFLEVT